MNIIKPVKFSVEIEGDTLILSRFNILHPYFNKGCCRFDISKEIEEINNKSCCNAPWCSCNSYYKDKINFYNILGRR